MKFDKKVTRKLIVPLIVIVCSTVFMLFRFGIASLIFTLPSDAGLILCFWGLIFLHDFRIKRKTGLKSLSLYMAILAGLANIIHGCILLYYSGVYNRPGSALDILGYFFLPLYTAVYMIAAYLIGSIIEAIIRMTIKPYRQEDLAKLKTTYVHVKKYKLIYGVSVLFVFLSSAYRITMMYLPDVIVNPFSDIHYAAQLGNVNQAKYFLDKGVDINVPENNSYKNTPLHIAAFHGQNQMVEFLVERGADIHARDAIDSTPLHRAARGGTISTISLLIRLGADVNIHDKNGDTPLRESARYGNYENVEIFINSGADINLKNNGNQTPLFQAVWYGYYDVVRLLLENDANVNVIDKKGRSFLSVAREKRYKNIENLLLEYGAKE